MLTLGIAYSEGSSIGVGAHRALCLKHIQTNEVVRSLVVRSLV